MAISDSKYTGKKTETKLIRLVESNSKLKSKTKRNKNVDPAYVCKIEQSILIGGYVKSKMQYSIVQNSKNIEADLKSTHTLTNRTMFTKNDSSYDFETNHGTFVQKTSINILGVTNDN